MEKAILKTLVYADIFDYPLKINEIHKWLIGRRVTLRQIEKTLGKLYQVSSIKYQGKYYFLPKCRNLVSQRLRKEKQSEVYFKKAKVISQILKLIPWIKLVGISGGLAMDNAGKSDDIDLFIITGKNRLWISRLLCLGLLSLLGQRRKAGDTGRKIAGKLCPNTLLEEDKLEQKSTDLFIAHEVLQMRPLWQRDGIYSKYLEDNSWVFKFLPNWIMNDTSLRGVPTLGCGRRSNLPHRIEGLPRSLCSLAMTGIENLAKKFQLSIMKKPTGLERIEEGALYFHPDDCRERVLFEYRRRLKLAPLDK